MNPLQQAWQHRLLSMLLSCFSQCINASIRNGLTFDKANASELGQSCQLFHTRVCQTQTACKINVSDSVTCFDKLNNSSICDMGTMAQMDVVEVLAQLGYCEHRSVRNLLAFGKDKVSEPRGGFDNLLYSLVVKLNTRCKIKDPETFK